MEHSAGSLGARPLGTRRRGFTIVEVLVVMAIILVLAGLILATSSYVHNKGARSRAEAEIAAMSAALENYKADNGVYPTNISLNAKSQGNPSAYQSASTTLYQSMIGDKNADGLPDAGATSYMLFKPNQVGGSGATAYVKDPFGNSYGYSTIYQSDSTKGYNPTFDLWSTAGVVDTSATPNSVGWIKNW